MTQEDRIKELEAVLHEEHMKSAASLGAAMAKLDCLPELTLADVEKAFLETSPLKRP